MKPKLDSGYMYVADSNSACCVDLSARNSAPAEVWRHLIEPVEGFLESVAARLALQVTAFDPAVASYAEYALNGSGKHLRPALVALGATAVGQPSEAHVSAAVVIEMVHLATLVHDDVMDEAELRRGQPTVAARWGNETAVLFGDCLFAEALRLSASFPTPDVCRAVAAATNTVCAGEILQTRARGNFELSEAEYRRIIDMKTAELFALSCDLAAFLAAAPAPQRSALRDFGRAFGVAYQIYDDCQDVFGSEAEAGKSLGTDLAKGKVTLPWIELRQRARGGALAAARRIFREGGTGRNGELRQLLADHDVFAACGRAVQVELERARQALELLPGTEGTQRLASCGDFLAEQMDGLRKGTRLQSTHG